MLYAKRRHWVPKTIGDILSILPQHSIQLWGQSTGGLHPSLTSLAGQPCAGHSQCNSIPQPQLWGNMCGNSQDMWGRIFYYSRPCKWGLGQDHLIPKEFGDYIMCVRVQPVQGTLGRSVFLETIFVKVYICFLGLPWHITTNWMVDDYKNAFSHSSGGQESRSAKSRYQLGWFPLLTLRKRPFHGQPFLSCWLLAVLGTPRLIDTTQSLPLFSHHLFLC